MKQSTKATPPPSHLAPPLRGEPFSIEHLWTHAQELAGQQRVSISRGDDRRFIEAFENNARFVSRAYRTISTAVRDGEPITPAAEWVLDNYHVVEEQLREIREDLPRGYYHELPKLLAGPWGGYPRVYELANELVVHTDSSLDLELIAGFVEAYQQTAPLTSGEIWAVPIMLRLVLIENLRRLCGHILAAREHRLHAERLIADWRSNEQPADSLPEHFHPPLLVMHLMDSLREPNPDHRGICLHDVAQRLGQEHDTIDDLVRKEQQRLAADQVSIGNLVTSMQVLGGLDWKGFFERVSLVEQALREDPAGVYEHMDFATRDLYRHQVEVLAKRCRVDETRVAAEAVTLAVESTRRESPDARSRHVGFFLIDSGRIELEGRIGYQPSMTDRLVRMLRQTGLVFYVGGITTLTIAAAAGLFLAANSAFAIPELAALVAVLALLPASELAVGLMNVLVTHVLKPRALPKIEFKDHVPTHCQTLVAIPGMLTGESGIRSLLERLEIHYLANPEPGLQYSLLTDFGDADHEALPEDSRLLEQAHAGIRALNIRYANGASPRFHLLHRPRRWNAVQCVWMGWERKRGKLHELNLLLRGNTETSYEVDDTTRERLRGIKYVITLDADTRLPFGVARQLVGTIAHPLNRAHFDPRLERVTSGYGILQPRIGISLSSAGRSWFARLFANSPGVDPYCMAVSDVYQDLFSEGSYTGKGIYDVDAFAAATDVAFPENHILSHDLIEGCHARVGLVTDLELFDDYPARYDAEARRQHRWVRGDWQLLPWLMAIVPTAVGRRPNSLTFLSRWKIFDNLRRSLVAPALVVLLVAGWLTPRPVAFLLTLCVVTVLATPLICQLLSSLIGWRGGPDWNRQLRGLAADSARLLAQTGVLLVFLPYRAMLMVDAVGRSLFRMFVSRCRLLDWETADAAERRLKNDRWSALREMWWVPLVSLGLALAVNRAALPVALPILLAWFVSPAICDWISRTIAQVVRPLSTDDIRDLRRIARKTWSFFEAFVDQADNWLPPDNVQEYPKLKVAHRVSPTNEGLFILSAIAAGDFGFVSVSRLVELLEHNLETLEKLPRERGHFYNWYNTQTLEALPPRYLSTVDSGNLAACLITARQGLIDLARQPIFDQRIIEGVVDSVTMVEETLGRFQPRGARFGGSALDALEKCLKAIRTAGKTGPVDPLTWWDVNEVWQTEAANLETCLQQFESAVGIKIPELETKVQLLVSHLRGIRDETALLIPWLGFATERSVPDPSRPDSGAERRWIVSQGESPDAWRSLTLQLSAATTPEALSKLAAEVAPLLESLRSRPVSQSDSPHLPKFEALAQAIDEGSRRAAELCTRLDRLGNRYSELALEMDFTLLFNPQRGLFSIGYNLDESRLDRGHYDLLASESRLASLIAIAKGDVEHRHWFQLGRTLTDTEGAKTLLSWGGTMFEFLMPTLFARDFSGSLLDQSCHAAVERQIAYGRQSGVPWGISESAFSAQAANSDYHYQSFGVPGLGLKRGLAKDLVISPYSTALATAVDPVAATLNFRKLIAEGGDGEWGMYDALDYTPARVPEGERRVVVYCYMAHHHGMTMLALVNCLLDHRIQRRFQSQPMIRATELLLQERIPVAVLEFQPRADETAAVPHLPEGPGPVSRRLSSAGTAVPRTHLLSNGQYTVMVTNSGAGYSNCRDKAVTRWRADSTKDDCGQFLYIRNLQSGKVWSAGHQPTGVRADVYEVTYSVDKVEFHRIDGDFESFLEIAVSPENNSEIRQLTIKNHGRKRAALDITSYAEVVLTPAAADQAHPAFSKLFIETEYRSDRRALLARRRPRDAGQQAVWAVHVLALPPGLGDAVQYETDRARFLGRGRTCANPAALEGQNRLSGTTGPVLDPIFSLRQAVQIAPDESISLAFVTAFAESRDEALLLADQYHDARVVQRTFELAWADSRIELHRMKVSPAGVQLYQRLASAVLFPEPTWRPAPDVLQSNTRGQSALWRFGISGDDPIVLIRITHSDQRGLLRELLLAHEFWHAHGLIVDLVVLNERPAGYFDELNEQLRDLIQTTVHSPLDRPGGVYLLRGGQVASGDRILLQCAAAVTLHGENGSLSKQIEAAGERPYPPEMPPFRPVPGGAVIQPPVLAPASQPPLDLQFAGPFGGFSADGRTYQMRLSENRRPPAPWSNVIANPDFGFLVTESGGGFTWAGNSRENKLTSWSNDPVADPPGEALYIRDEECGTIWSPTPAPIRDGGDLSIEHGHGFSRFTRTAQNIGSDLLLAVAPRDTVKFISLKLRNAGERARTLSLTYYAEWVLGVARERTQMHVWTSVDKATGALVAQNPYHPDVPGQVAFLHVLDRPASVTGDRTEFLGRNGSMAHPAALGKTALSGTTGAGIDPCGAVQKRLSLAPGEEREIVFLLGSAANQGELADLLVRYREPEQVRQAIQEAIALWDRRLTAIEVKTPNRAFDLLVNRWLVYQTLSCRLWGRSAFYQSGGAYGFRDQLQDVMALVYAQPDLAREHILRAAARQFEEGDVQHWWHPPNGRGVRTRFADDFLWLPLAASHYVTVTGDSAILDREVGYLQSALLAPHEEERYELPEISSVAEDLYAHCVRALEHGFRFGPRGLPLMGTGDWNDGMNKVGVLGQGESVWMAWFLIFVLRRFVPIVEGRGDHQRAADYRGRIDDILRAVESRAWDGKWYKRAFFDDGTPLGSAENDECRIDSIAQSWSVFAQANPERTRTAMQAVEEHLVRETDRLILLFDPPFDKSQLDPGYIKGYLPGIRENGGQYTHAALWVVLATALEGRGTRAMQLLDMLNPILHSSDVQQIDRYRVEPFVVAADVYSQPPHAGRGGWTWYTGSAAWMYRVALESILGLDLQGNRLRINPCIPGDWAGFELTVRRGETPWRIAVQNPKGLERGTSRVTVDGVPISDGAIFLTDDRREHSVEIEIESA